MIASNYLKDQFLIAMPNLDDSNFSHTVSYLCQHNEEGALAIVINRPTGLTLNTILKQMGIETELERLNHIPVFSGGPVQQERGFIIHSNEKKTWESSMPTSKSTSLTSSRDILEAIARGEGPEHYLIALGYAGWGAGQLENEIINNAWLNTPSNESILYKTPINERWAESANQLGININHLTSPAGHG